MPASSSSSDKKKKNKTVAPQMMVMQPMAQPMQPGQQMQMQQMQPGQQMQPMQQMQQMQQMQPGQSMTMQPMMQMQPMQAQQPIAVMQPAAVEKKKKKKKGSKSSSSSSDKHKTSEVAKEAKSFCKLGCKALACYIGGPVILCFIIIIVIAIAGGGTVTVDDGVCDPLCTTDQPEDGPQGQYSCTPNDDCTCGGARTCSAFGWCQGWAWNDYCPDPATVTDTSDSSSEEPGDPNSDGVTLLNKTCPGITNLCDELPKAFDCEEDCDCNGSQTCGEISRTCGGETLCDWGSVGNIAADVFDSLW